MTSVRKLSSSTLDEIEEFLRSQNTSHPFQHPMWSSGNDDEYCLFLRKSGKLRFFALCGTQYPLGVRRASRIRALTITRGPVCDDLEYMRSALAQLVAEGKVKGLVYIDINPDWIHPAAQELGSALEIDGWIPVGNPRSSLRIDLVPDMEQIQSTFRKVARYESRRAERMGLEVTPMRRIEVFKEFYGLYADMARRKHFAPDAQHHLRHVVEQLVADENRGAVLLSYYCGEMTGGAVIVRSGRRCWYVWGASKKDSGLSPGHLLQVRAIRWAKEHRCAEYDLGGYQEGATTGPAFFKRGFSETIVRFLPTYRRVVSPFWYAVYRSAEISRERLGKGLWARSR